MSQDSSEMPFPRIWDSLQLRLLAESGDKPRFLAELDRQMVAFGSRVSFGTPEGDAELAEFARRMFADPLRDEDPDATYTEDDQGNWHQVLPDGKPGQEGRP